MAAYVVMRTGFEYNDETYNAPECGGGKPMKVLLDKKDAEKIALRMNAQELKRLFVKKELMDYCYYDNPFKKTNKFIEYSFKKLFNSSFDAWFDAARDSDFMDLVGTLTDDEWEKLYSYYEGQDFFYVAEVEIAHALA